MINKIKEWWNEWKRKRRLKKRLRDLERQDPFKYD